MPELSAQKSGKNLILDFEETAYSAKAAASGKRGFLLEGNGKFCMRSFPLALAPNAHYEMTAQIRKENLSEYFPEFRRVSGDCRFLDCSHRKEPGCAVRSAKENGMIAEIRYNSYCRLYEELAAAGNHW